MDQLNQLRFKHWIMFLTILITTVSCNQKTANNENKIVIPKPTLESVSFDTLNSEIVLEMSHGMPCEVFGTIRMTNDTSLNPVYRIFFKGIKFKNDTMRINLDLDSTIFVTDETKDAKYDGIVGILNYKFNKKNDFNVTYVNFSSKYESLTVRERNRIDSIAVEYKKFLFNDLNRIFFNNEKPLYFRYFLCSSCISYTKNDSTIWFNRYSVVTSYNQNNIDSIIFKTDSIYPNEYIKNYLPSLW